MLASSCSSFLGIGSKQVPKIASIRGGRNEVHQFIIVWSADEGGCMISNHVPRRAWSARLWWQPRDRNFSCILTTMMRTQVHQSLRAHILGAFQHRAPSTYTNLQRHLLAGGGGTPGKSLGCPNPGREERFDAGTGLPALNTAASSPPGIRCRILSLDYMLMAWDFAGVLAGDRHICESSMTSPTLDSQGVPRHCCKVTAYFVSSESWLCSF